jgi:hypothetical protein
VDHRPEPAPPGSASTVTSWEATASVDPHSPRSAVRFSVGPIAEDMDVEEPLIVQDCDAALHVASENRAAKARYLTSGNR